MPRSVSGRSGFTLVEILVGLVLMTMLAGVIVPRVLGRVGQGEAAALTGNLAAVTSAVNEFKRDLGRYPRSLAHLAAPPPAGAQDACNYQIPDLNRWRGPYLDRQVPATGLRSGTSVIQNGFDVSSVAAGAFKTLTVRATDVDRDVADRVEAAIDGDANLLTGTVQWSAAGGTPTRGTLRYVVPIRGC